MRVKNVSVSSRPESVSMIEANRVDRQSEPDANVVPAGFQADRFDLHSNEKRASKS